MPKTTDNWMTEPEVALLLASHLLRQTPGATHADVAIDNATVGITHKSADGAAPLRKEYFPLVSFLATEGWEQTDERGRKPWQGKFRRGPHTLSIEHKHGADVVIEAGVGRVLAECKAGPLTAVKGRGEDSILCVAIGQAITMKGLRENDKVVVAVPSTRRFEEVARGILALPLVRRTGICVMLVGQDGEVIEL